MIAPYLETLRKHLEKSGTLPKIIVICGPTACGKTDLSISIAKFLDTEILSADSRQIYQDMDIGTGKVTREEMQDIPHHMLDVISPKEIFSMASYGRMVLPIIESIGKRGNIPILCGGTGLYIDSVLYEMAIPESEPDWAYRDELEKIRQEKGNEYLWKMLEDVDPMYAHELEANNFRYVMRGLEVMRDTGISKRESYQSKKLRFDPVFLTPYTDSTDERKILYDLINKRVHGMFQSGLVDEVKYLIQKYGAGAPGLTTIGYREVVEYLSGQISLDQAEALIAQRSRNYAKRQITWNKKYFSDV